MKLNDAIHKLSEELNLPYEVVKAAYYSFWEFIKLNIESLPFKEGITEEEFNSLHTSFNIPSLGKFHTNYIKVSNLHNKYKNGRVKDKKD